MKKQFLLLFALVALTFTMQAQSRMIAHVSDAKVVGNFEIQRLLSSYNQADHIGTVDLRNVQQGRNHLLTDLRNGRKLMLLAEREGTRVKVVGFMIQEKDGRYFKLPNPSSSQAKPGDTFGCPDNWDAKIICYTHPTYNVQVCYLRCTPTQLTLQLPAGL